MKTYLLVTFNRNRWQVSLEYPYRDYKKYFAIHKSYSELHRYWKQPWDGSNRSQDYAKEEKKKKRRSQFSVDTIKRYADLDAKILEIGCNVGRNLNYLFLAGFKNLYGIEISEEAVKLLEEYYPEMAAHSQIYNLAVESIIRTIEDEKFDIVLTMAVLEHIHTDSEWIFSEIVRITRNWLVTIEDEWSISWRHFLRNNKNIFECLGMKEIEQISLSG